MKSQALNVVFLLHTWPSLNNCLSHEHKKMFNQHFVAVWKHSEDEILRFCQFCVFDRGSKRLSRMFGQFRIFVSVCTHLYVSRVLPILESFEHICSTSSCYFCRRVNWEMTEGTR